MRASPPSKPQGDGDEFLVEFHRVGQSVKVSALDPRSGVEVSIVGPANASESLLARNAVAKLKRRLQILSDRDKR